MSSVEVPADLRVVPDMGDELLYVLDQVEELLLTLAGWEQDEADVTLPEPFARRSALVALEEVGDAVRPTQSRNEREPVPGRLLGSDGRYEHLPLRFVHIPASHLQVLEHAAQELGNLGAHHDLADAVEQHADANRVSAATLVGGLSRAVSVLGLSWDDDVRTLWGAVVAHPSTADVVLSDAEEQAYGRVAGRINALWSYGSGIDRFLF